MEALFGVIIGGVIAGMGTWISLWNQHRRWKDELRLKILQDKRRRLEEMGPRVLSAVAKENFRTTITLDPELYDYLKKLAKQEDRSLASTVRYELRKWYAEK